MSPRGDPTMSFGVPPFTRGVKWLAIATLAVSVGVAVLGQRGEDIATNLAFIPGLLLALRLWTPFTYTFLNLEPINLLFSLLALWLIGAALEQRWGTRRFVTFYFLSAALAAVATFLVGFVAPPVYRHAYAGNWSALAGLVAAFSVLMPDARIFLYFVPIQARWMLPISAGITVLFMLMTGWVPYLPELFGLGAGVLLAGRSPGNILLRARVWWIDRKLRKSKLRVVRGVDKPFGRSGSDKFRH